VCLHAGQFTNTSYIRLEQLLICLLQLFNLLLQVLRMELLPFAKSPLRCAVLGPTPLIDISANSLPADQERILTESMAERTGSSSGFEVPLLYLRLMGTLNIFCLGVMFIEGSS
jgi:hypothetical protein